MRTAAVQCTASSDRAANLRRASELVGAAADAGAELVVLPELFSLSADAAGLRAHAEPLDGPTGTWACETAARHGLWLVAGSFIERAPTGGLHNTSVLVSPDGAPSAVYRKVHLFDVDVPGAVSRESDVVSPGDDLVLATVVDTAARALPVGMTICYDLRFPEVYRILTLRGALVMVVPSAFSAQTGPAHWEVLVRARALENQVFVVAAGQVGARPGTFAAYGHTMIVDPWGQVLASLREGEGHVVVDLDLRGQQEVRSRLPALPHRRPGVYRWPPLATPGSGYDRAAPGGGW